MLTDAAKFAFFLGIFASSMLQTSQYLDFVSKRSSEVKSYCENACIRNMASKTSTSSDLMNNLRSVRRKNLYGSVQWRCFYECFKRETRGLRKRKGLYRSRRNAETTFTARAEGFCRLSEFQEYGGPCVGEIYNLSVAFKQREVNNASSWFADISWNINVTDPSSYEDDRWAGFVIFMVTVANDAFCSLVDKNQTRLSIQSKEGRWTYPNKTSLLVQLFPYPYDQNKDPDTVTTFTFQEFSPRTDNSTKSSTQTVHQRCDLSHRTTTSATTPRATSEPQTSTKPSTRNSSNRNASKPESTLPSNYLDNPGPDANTMLVKVIAIVIGVAAGGILVVVVVKYIFRQRKIKTANLMSSGSQYEYDASIIYSNYDSDFVNKTLLPFLENRLNLRCFIHYKDWTIGAAIHENIAKTVYNSRYVIAVISRHFLESNFCKTELDMALERLLRLRDDSLLVIKMDGVNKEELPKALRNRTFLDFSQRQERNNWENRLERQISREEGTDAASQKGDRYRGATSSVSSNESANSRETFI